MAEIAPTSIEDKLASMQKRIDTSNQEKADKERSQHWLGFDTEKDTFTEKQIARAQSLRDYKNSRPDEGEVVDTSRTQWLDPNSLQNDTIENTDGAYVAESDMDKELLYLEHEFNTISSPEDVAAALDLVSDFCDAHNLDRAVEKQLRARFLKTTHENEPVAETGKDVPDLIVENTIDDQDANANKHDDSKEANELAIGTTVQLTDEKGVVHSGVITNVELDESHPSGVKYTITSEAGDGKYFTAHQEDLTLLEDEVVIPEVIEGKAPVPTTPDSDIEDAEVIEDTTQSEDEQDTEALNKEAPDTNSETTSQEGENNDNGEETVSEKSIGEKIKDAPTALYLAVSAKLIDSRKKWSELEPDKKKKYKWIGAAATGAVLLGIALLSTRGHDTSSINESITAGGPDALDISSGVSEASSANALTSTQMEFAESYANTPWQAAVDAYGSDKAADALKSAVEKAQAAGENIRTSGEGSSWKIQANGSWNTQEVTKVLAEYMPKK